MRLRTVISVLLVAALSCAAVPPCGAQSEKDKLYDKSYALVIGISNYKHPEKWKKIANASNDAKSVAQFLSETGFEVVPLYNEQADKDAIANAFATLSQKVGENDRVVIFFAGHGDTKTLGGQDRGFIVPWEATEAISTYIDMDDLKKYSGYMNNAKHQLFIMDSCYGGTLGREDSTRAARPNSEAAPKSPTYLREITRPKAREVLTAGGKDQEVLDGGGLFEGHSLFTGRLLDGLKYGRADLDNDGYITFTELVAYMVKNASNSKQTPHSDALEGHIGGRDFVFLSPASIRRKILISRLFEPQDASQEANPILQMMGPNLLLKDFEDLQEAGRIWNVEFKVAGTSQEIQTRGDQGSAPSVGSTQQQSDYLLEVKYLPLDKERVQVQAQFKKNAENLPDIPVQRVELSSKSLDFKSLAREILRQFASDADFHLHLDMLQFANCPAEIEGQVRGSIEPWLTELRLSRIKYLKEKDNNAAADVGVFAMMFVSPEGNRNVFTVNVVVRHASRDPKTFSANADAASWKAALKEVEDKVEAYLADLVKQF